MMEWLVRIGKLGNRHRADWKYFHAVDTTPTKNSGPAFRHDRWLAKYREIKCDWSVKPTGVCEYRPAKERSDPFSCFKRKN